MTKTSRKRNHMMWYHKFLRASFKKFKLFPVIACALLSKVKPLQEQIWSINLMIFLNLIFGGLLTFRTTVRRAMDAIASHVFFHNEDFPKNCWSVSWMLFSYLYDAIYQMHFSPSIYWIRASISIRRWKKIAFDQSNRVGFMALLLIKQKCIEPSTNMKQVSTLCFLFTWNQQVNFSYSPNMFWSFVLATLMSRIDDSVCWLLVTTVYYWNFPLCYLFLDFFSLLYAY